VSWPANAWAGAALRALQRPFPWASGHLAQAPDDLPGHPREAHPAFHGAWDWHSGVHMVWSLITLRPHVSDPAAIDTELDARLTPEAIAAELDYLRCHPGFERPYGWAWAALLATTPSPWAPALAPLADHLADAVLDWLPKQAYPIRYGMHANSAFALTLLLAAYDPAAGARADVVAAVRARAAEWFAADAAAATGAEPSGADFLSPALTEATLMRRVLPAAEFARWFGAFRPGFGRDPADPTLAVPQVRDPADGQFAHLYGLALSRAWQLRTLAAGLPAAAAEPVRSAADAQFAFAQPQITGGDFAATHWLVSFALLATGALG
jgi:hypothetical protein